MDPVYRIIALRESPQRRGRRQMPKPPGASSMRIFGPSYRKMSGWNGTLPFFLILFSIDFLEGIVRYKQVFHLPAQEFCLAHDIETT